MSDAVAEMNMFDCIDKTLSDHSLLVTKVRALDLDILPSEQETGANSVDKHVDIGPGLGCREKKDTVLHLKGTGKVQCQMTS